MAGLVPAIDIQFLGVDPVTGLALAALTMSRTKHTEGVGATSDKLPRYNHYVPKFILNNFSRNGKICIFDKHLLKEFKLPPYRAMGEKDFTNVKFDDVTVSFENRFTHLENIAAPIIEKILKQKSLSSLDPMEVAALHMFVLIQYNRSKRRRLDYDLITEEIKKRWPDAPVNPWQDRITDSELTKFSTLNFTFSNLEEMTGHFVYKHSYLMLRDCRDEIYTSDNPLVMHNQKQYGPYGNIGIGVPHIEIYYPLSPDIILAYMCRMTMKEIETEQQKSEAEVSAFFGKKFLSPSGLSQKDTADLAEARLEIQRSKKYYSMIKNERLVPMSAENVLYVNSLQVASSYRYLAARKAEFQFARRALSEKPHWKDGLQLNVA
jgi:hypothetical protein